MKSPDCFISYSWDSESHKEWVLYLAEELQTRGVNVLLDQWDLKLGADLPKYVETCVRNSDYVILVCTPTFAKKANLGLGGVGYEKTIVTGEIFNHVSKAEKFVPVLRKGDISDSIPSYLQSKIYADFRDDSKFEKNMELLLRHVHNEPPFKRPALGPKPSFATQKSTSRGTIRKIIYCKRCGTLAGQENSCTGIYSYHDFASSTGTVYCSRCGALPGQRSACSGIYTYHDFVSSKEQVFCRRCGALPGQKRSCVGIYTYHDYNKF